MIKEQQLYRNSNNVDVDLFIHHVINESDKGVKVYANFVHRKYGYVYDAEEYEIKQTDFKNWKLVK